MTVQPEQAFEKVQIYDWLNKPINSLDISLLTPGDQNENMLPFITGKEDVPYSEYQRTFVGPYFKKKIK